ncbi:BZ3500_MvSof-1268-A1-R1_Chr9g10866 [Microbotryum saponariae]|uniref:BZ3500_MvSof-1268-A1-R1_Chr9g10866 protein n=1 Tax=Microbotryum saponariae TaxID=289078 RepID=A0A2X0L7B5_9BASI|nr:BZ3501_MvSof-1269-A2-R1_Chr9g10614 [Microbotryum saponariae]SDA00830.1 BZ3500_MvSof-1268-A1-R1_Chr9g10866 [Microbotryum saponariae]
MASPYLVVVDHEACRIATISDCWDEGFGELGVVVSILLELDIYSAGLSPLFRYECHASTGFTPISFITQYLREGGDDARLIGRTVEFIDEEPVELIDSAVASGAPAPSFVLKIQYNTPNRIESEARVLRMIEQRCASAPPELSALILSHTARLEKAKSFGLHCSQMRDMSLPIPVDQEEESQQRVQRRKLDLLILRNPSPLPTRVDRAASRRHPLKDAYHVFDQLLTLLPVLYDLGIHHRDLSLGNILHYRGHLVLVDWDTAIVAPSDEPVPICAADDRSEESVRVTLTTTPFSVLLWILKEGWMDFPSHILANDLESATYWFMLVLGSFREESTGTGVWRALYLAPMRAQPSLGLLASGRLNLWSNSVKDQRKRNELLEAVRELDPAEGKVVDMFTRFFPAWGLLPDHLERTKALMEDMQVKMREYLGLQPHSE